jgi:hypothetical protein
MASSRHRIPFRSLVFMKDGEPGSWVIQRDLSSSSELKKCKADLRKIGACVGYYWASLFAPPGIASRLKSINRSARRRLGLSTMRLAGVPELITVSLS